VLRHEERPRQQFLWKHEDTAKFVWRPYSRPAAAAAPSACEDTEAIKALFLKLVSNMSVITDPDDAC
jgi:hypothetical protein